MSSKVPYDLNQSNETSILPYLQSLDLSIENCFNDYCNLTSTSTDNFESKIKLIIIDKLTVNRIHLSDVCILIKRKFNLIILSSIDEVFIEKEYVKCCSNLWLKEVSTKILSLISKTNNDIVQLLSSLDNVSTLNDIPEFFKQIVYCKLLIEQNLLNCQDERLLIKQIRTICIEQLLQNSDSALIELKFLDKIVDLLNSYIKIDYFIEHFKLKKFCEGRLQFSQLMDIILSYKDQQLNNKIFRERLIALQEIVKCLQKESTFHTIQNLKNILNSYVKPVEIITTSINNDNYVVEVIGRNIILDDILSSLENELSKLSVREPRKMNIEVRFISSDVIYMNSNFRNEIWHGINVILFTKQLNIPQKISWEISGENSKLTYTDNAGVGTDGNGKDGADGYPGENGGNVLFLVEKIENFENITITSNGGQGSNGQDGGNGRNGENGKSISKSEMEKMYPPPAKFRELIRAPYLMTIVNSIKDNLKEMRKEWYKIPRGYWRVDENYNRNVIDKIIKDIKSNRSHQRFKGNIYINAVTNEGNEITFSFERGGATVNCQAYFLYKGSLGKLGGKGGMNGLGGQGGHPGEIKVTKLLNDGIHSPIKFSAKKGDDGIIGQGGLYGKPGCNGWDIGYLDYSVSNFFNSEWPKFYGTNENTKLRLDYNNSSTSDNVLCSYKEHYDLPYKYAEIDYGDSPNSDIYEQKRRIRQSNERQQHAKASKKHSISESMIFDKYSHYINSTEKSDLQNLASSLENIKRQALQSVNDNNQKDDINLTSELKVKRFVQSSHGARNKQHNTDDTNYVQNKNIFDRQNAQSLIINLKSSPNSLEKWMLIKTMNFNLLELNKIYSLFQQSEITSLQSKNYIKMILITKYKFASLLEIANKMLPYQTIIENSQIESTKLTKYLVQSEKNDFQINDTILGSLNDYIYKDSLAQRKAIINHSNKHNQILKLSLRAFVLETGILTKDSFKEAYIHYGKYKIYLEKFENGLIVFDKSLDKLDSDCCNNKALLSEYFKYIKEIGFVSTSYRVLLAYLFKVNIRLYTNIDGEPLFLQDSHNTTANKVIHILQKDRQLTQLSIDENYYRLEEERRQNDANRVRILATIESVEKIEVFQNYVNNDTLLTDKSESLCKPMYLPINNDEAEDIEKILQYFDKSENLSLRKWLEKVSFPYIRQRGILYYIVKRFSCEGRHISNQELHYLINSVVTSTLDESAGQFTFLWVIVAYPQNYWINELILLRLEDYFKSQLPDKQKWREYLAKIDQKNILLLLDDKLEQSTTISNQCIQDIFHMLSIIPDKAPDLRYYGLSEWPSALKETYWSYRLSKLGNWQNIEEELPMASYYVLSIENAFGTDIIDKLFKILEKRISKLTDKEVLTILSQFVNDKSNLGEKELNILNKCDINEWIKSFSTNIQIESSERNVIQLVELIKDNANTSPSIAEHLPTIAESVKEVCNDMYTISGKPVNKFTEQDIYNWSKSFQEENHNDTVDTRHQILHLINRAIELKRGIRLRDTQLLTIITLLSNNHNTLVQVSTGEGKSLIVVAVSIVKALYGQYVDVVTSSSVLAKRDAESNKDLFDLFNVSVAHNCSEDNNKKKEAYFNGKVVYGDLSNFQRDYLFDKFYGKNILGNRRLDNIIIDEVDSMLLDKGNNMLYLSHSLSGLDKLESVYIYIWQWINASDMNNLNIEVIKDEILYDLYGRISIEDIENLNSELSEKDKHIIWNRLVANKVVDTKGKLLVEVLCTSTLNNILEPEFVNYFDRLQYLLKQCFERNRYIHVPNYLRPFIELHLESWIESAFVAAFQMKCGEDYVVDVDRTATKADMNPSVIILDKDTGTDQAKSEWDEALHQFLQLKHGCKLSIQSLKAVFTSNVTYFKLYDKMYGLTGTLGSRSERDLLKEIYDVEYFTVPTAKLKQFQEDKPIVCTDRDSWKDCIKQEVNKIIKQKQRSALIICNTVNDADILYSTLGGQEAKNVHKYVRDFEDFEIVKDNRKLEKGQIIIATNLAGRGTDIKISEELGLAGGLHVCLTYLPNNLRIEQQGFGRAARSGQKGSGQLIVFDCIKGKNNEFKIMALKKKRDADELCRLSEIRNYYETQIMTEEKCFKRFGDQFEQLKDDLIKKKLPNEVQEIIQQNCLDKWAFWLDENCKRIKLFAADEEEKKCFSENLERFINKLQSLRHVHDWTNYVDNHPVQMIKLGKYFCKKKKYSKAISLFNRVIIKEPKFSEAAHYYKAFALSKEIDWKSGKDLKIFKNELREAVKIFEEHSRMSMSASGVINKLKKSRKNCIIQIDAFEEQKQTVCNLYHTFTQNVNNILGNPFTPQHLVTSNTNEKLAETLYDDMLEKGILKKSRMKRDISEDELKTICFDYGLHPKILKDFLLNQHREISEKEIEKSLKKLKLPSREVFWDTLVKQQFLKDEVKYVVVDYNKLVEIDDLLAKKLNEKVEKKDIQLQNFESNKNCIIFSTDQIIQEHHRIFIKDDFKKIVNEKFKNFKKKGILLFNRSATINSNKKDNVKFSNFDSISLNDFLLMDITKKEGKDILTQLLAQKVIEEVDGLDQKNYKLKIEFCEIRELKLPTGPIYEDIVKRLLSICFAYRIALQNIVKQLTQKAQISLNLVSKPHKNLLLDLVDQGIIKPVTVTNKKDFDKIIENILKNRLDPSDENEIESLTKTIVQSQSLLKSVDVPDMKLKSLIEFYEKCEGEDIEEIRNFYVNGLDYLMELEEKKWTKKMLFNTGIVIAMGIVQIAVGAAIQIKCLGLMHHVGNGLISEGMNDIIYAFSALKSGYFSWNDYLKHKIKSVAITAVTISVLAILSKGTKMLKAGQKVIKDQSVLNEIGQQNFVNLNSDTSMFKEVAKIVCLKSTEATAFGLSNIGIDKLIENHLQKLCETVSADILLNVQNKVISHSICSNLKEIFTKDKNASKFVIKLTESHFTEQNCIEKYLPIAKAVCNGIFQGIAEASQITGKSLGLSKMKNVIKTIQWSQHVAQMYKVLSITDDLLDNLNIKINEKLKNQSENDKAISQTEHTDQNFEKFKVEMIERWKALLSQRIGKIITEVVIHPILNQGASYMIRYAGTKVRQAYESYKENLIRQEFEIDEAELNEIIHNRSGEIVNRAEEKLDKLALNTMRKTKDQKLFAKIVKKNVPMDMTCAYASTRMIYDKLKQSGVQNAGVKLIITTQNGIEQEFSYAPEGTIGQIYKIELDNYHFKASDQNMHDSSNYSRNNCYPEALIKTIPQLAQMSHQEIRNQIAQVIRTDPQIKSFINQGLQKYPISNNLYGGKEIIKMNSNELKEKIKKGKILFSQSSVSERTMNNTKYISELHESILHEGFSGKPIKAVNLPEAIVVLDNRRPLVSSVIDNVDIDFALYEPDEEFSTECAEQQYGSKNVSKAVNIRKRRGSIPDFNGPGYNIVDMRVRRRKIDPCNPPPESHEIFLNKLHEDTHIVIGGKSRRPKKQFEKFKKPYENPK